jgi:hypothetical protein
MTTTEERLRAATRAAAATVPPDSAPPLRLPEDPGVSSVPKGWFFRRRRLAALTPLAAAGAVAVVVIASLLLTSGVHTPPGGRAGPASSTSLPGGLPPYYLALSNQASPLRHVVIRATATGAALATVSVPRPYGTFMYVSGAADDRTFVLAVQRWWNITSGTRGLPAEHRDNTTTVAFFLLRFDPATRTARLTWLSHVAEPPSFNLGGIGLSPDGSRLALAVRTAVTPDRSGRHGWTGPAIQVVTLATGDMRQWVWPGAGWVGNFKPVGEPLSWTADGRMLAFQKWAGNKAQVRVLDTAAAGTDLRASRLIMKSSSGSGTVLATGNSLITPDGTAVVAATARYEQHPVRSELQVSEFSTRTGTMTHALAQWRLNHRGVSWQDVLWTSSSGRNLIVVTPPGTGPIPGTLNRPTGPVAGVLTTGGQFTPLRGMIASASTIAW